MSYETYICPLRKRNANTAADGCSARQGALPVLEKMLASMYIKQTSVLFLEKTGDQ